MPDRQYIKIEKEAFNNTHELPVAYFPGFIDLEKENIYGNRSGGSSFSEINKTNKYEEPNRSSINSVATDDDNDFSDLNFDMFKPREIGSYSSPLTPAKNRAPLINSLNSSKIKTRSFF
jgi:hypothetical protein